MGRRSYAMWRVRRGQGSDVNSALAVVLGLPLLFVFPFALAGVIGEFFPQAIEPPTEQPAASPEVLAEIEAETARRRAALEATLNFRTPQELRVQAAADDLSRYQQQMIEGVN